MTPDGVIFLFVFFSFLFHMLQLQGSSTLQRCDQSLPPLQAEVLHAVSSALA